jgi:hypothetical protein
MHKHAITTREFVLAEKVTKRTVVSFYWMNHCEHCGMKQGDFELFEEFDTPFRPINPEDASRIVLRSASEAFEASAASIAYEPGFFERTRILS